ncbi:hypothetical protein [Cyanobium sp. NS01]|jgi:hypothetical protein|uniref:hypothetical protein n=1 Tax=Cyanobium sp. NS01 TaxID=261284 RepID=UPI00185FB510|nr:hypothetical protein [Cyanobium sp. NS01]QNI70113.1 hypothetical protein CyaNS01_00976 [Cyanobium sp. NS01]
MPSHLLISAAATRWLLSPLLALGLLLLGPGSAAWGLEAANQPSRYSCDGDLLLARVENGAVDAPGIPNTLAGTLPGAFVVIDWRELHLQLPRTNNAGAPSFGDGRWWWSLEDPSRPTLLLQQAQQTSFACSALPASGSPAAAASR